MATNEVFNQGNQIDVTLASTSAGDPVVVGSIPGVALNATDANGKVTMKTDGVFTLSVKGIDSGGNSAVAAGDIIYYVSGDTPKLSKKATGSIRFGYALEAVASAATTTIRVKIGY